MAHSPRARSCFKRGGAGKTNKTNKWHQSVRHLGLWPGWRTRGHQWRREKGRGRRSSSPLTGALTGKKGLRRSRTEPVKRLRRSFAVRQQENGQTTREQATESDPEENQSQLDLRWEHTDTWAVPSAHRQELQSWMNPRATAKFLRMFCVCTFPLFC